MYQSLFINIKFSIVLIELFSFSLISYRDQLIKQQSLCLNLCP